MKKKTCDSGNGSDNVGGDLKQKERRIVSWTEEEDDILREQIGIHGTNNWVIIASKFENKSTRQCRRRWFTYLNSNFKRGGWSPEEDVLLCEAQKKFGNRWTEIAKVVPGRTDNAVKNRFSVLCKRRAQHEASTKENSSADVNTNKKRVMFDNRHNTYGNGETSVHPMKMRRKHITSTTEDRNLEEGLVKERKNTDQQLRRPPLMVLVQNCRNSSTSSAQVHDNTSSVKTLEETCLKQEDPKVVATAQDDLCDVKPLPSEPIHTTSVVDGKNIGECNAATNQVFLPSCYEFKNDVGGVCPLPNSEFSSPIQVTPLFRSMAQGIPSPQFSESEKSFLLKTLGMESRTPDTTSQSPPCKKALLHCL